MSKLTGLKDVDREVLRYVDDKELLKVCTIDRRMWNDVCDDAFLRRRLNSKYLRIEKYKKENETWKAFYLKAIYYISKMKEDEQFAYTEGDFEKQYQILKFYSRNISIFEKAAEEGELSLVKYALQRGANIHGNFDYALRYASKAGHLEVVKYLVERGANIHADDDFSLQRASEGGHLEVVKYLIEQGADIHADNDEALRFAVSEGHLEIVKYLVSRGADIHLNNDETLKIARRKNYTDIENFLKSLK